MRIAEVPSRPVLGTFTKATDGARALSYAPSGGSNCSTACPYHPETESRFAVEHGARCYAARCERRPDRLSLAAKLEVHEALGADSVTAAAIRELDRRRAGFRLPWFRFSPFGSVPDQIPARFVDLCRELHDAGTPIHLPIEDRERTERYADALPFVAVRWSIPAGDGVSWGTYLGPASTVAGSMDVPPMDRLAEAKRVARERTEATGRRAIVCPAVASSTYRKRGRNVHAVKCGECTACADASVDVVYPAHA